MMLYKLVSTMDPARFDNRVVTLWEGGALAGQIEAAGIPVRSLSMARGRPDPRGVMALVRLLREERPDVLQTWMYHANLLGTFGARLACVRRLAWNVRTSDFVGPDPSHQTRLASRLCAVLTRTPLVPEVVVANARSGVSAHAAQGYRPRRWEVIPNGFDLGRFKPDTEARAGIRRELGLASNTPLVGHLARLDPMKDHATFFKAASTVVAGLPGTHFLLAGGGVDACSRQLRALVADAQLNGFVHLLGERKDVPSLLAALDVFVSSSAYGEGFSNVIGEAMACGVPCVVTDVGDSAAIVGGAGSVVPPGDPGALASAVSKLLRLMPEERRTIGGAAREQVRERYSLAAVVRRYEELYESLAVGG